MGAPVPSSRHDRIAAAGRGFLLSVMALILPVSGIHAQRYLVHSYTESTGLPSSKIFAVTQDDAGCMWFATRTGVARYDGWEWRIYEPAQGLALSEGELFHWDDRAHLWIVSKIFPGHLHHFDGEAWLPLVGPEPLPPGTRITALGAGTHGLDVVVALGTLDGRVFLRRGGSWTSLSVGPDPVLAVTFADGNLFVGSAKGLAVANLDVPEPAVSAVPSVKGEVLAVSPEGESGKLWIAGPDWVGWLQGESFTLLRDHLPRDPLLPPSRFVLEPDSRGGVYIGNWTGIFHVDAQRELESLGPGNGLLSAGTTDIHVDREGNAWIVSGRGASKIVSYRIASYRREHGLYQDEVSAVLQRATGEIALGHPHGLTLFGEKMRTLEIPHDGRRTRILDLAEESQGRLWMAVEGWGIAEVREADGELRLRWREDAPGSASSVMVDSRGRIWASTEQGLYRSEGGPFEPIATPPTAQPIRIRRLFDGSDDAIYAATAGSGLFRLRDGRWESWDVPEDQEASNVFSVLEVADDTVLVGTGKGLYRVAPDRLIEANPRVERPVYFLLQDTAGRLWIGTDNGVLRWDGESLEPFTVREGVIARETNRAGGMVDSNGHVWIGTEQGVSVYRSELERPVTAAPSVALLDVDVSGRHYPLQSAVTLSHRDRDVRFRFRAVSFLDENRIEIRARLDGFDPDWLTLGNSSRRELRYTNLPPGEYRFRIQAANARGLWSEIVASESITVLAPFWRRGWFALIALLAVGGAGLIVQHYLGQRQYARRLEKEVRQKLLEQREIEEELTRAKRLEALGVLAGGIAHDFNNLMTTILGNLSLIKFDSQVQSDSRQNLANAEAAILRARDLTGQLLTFSRGGGPVRETAPIGEIIRESVSFVTSGSNVRCSVELPDDLWFVDIDAGQMSQVISNLLINSIEAMPQGGSLTVSGRNIEMTAVPPFEKRSIQIVIRDDGHGIAREHLARIFDPYFSTKQRGSGLGLATAYSIVRRHDGRLIAESELGQGTTFRIFLPASESQPKKPVEATAPVVDGSARVLVMDDEPAVREVIGAVLAERGYEIEFAEDGSQAIARYSSTMHEGCPFDVVILDLTVRGGMGGQEAMRRLKELDPDVKAIVVSGYSSDPVMARYSDYGFSGCVQKPFQTEELIRIVAEVAAIPTPSTD